jgi:uncharacterized protein (TIGR02001 family)
MSIAKYTSLGAASLLAAAVFAGPALADGMPSRGRIADAPAPRACTTAGNVGLTTDYVFRGISQTFEDPAVQGGVDFTCGRFYAGVWASNVDFGAAGPFDTIANVEIDLYGGFKHTTGPVTWDVGFIYYSYPGNNNLTDLDYLELKLAASGEVWKGGTLGGTVFFSPEYTGETGEVWTLEASFAQALPRVGMFSPTLSATYGNVRFSDFDFDYSYWNVGLNVGFLEKWSVDLRYWDSSLDDDCDNLTGLTNSVCDSRIVGSVKYTF